MRTFKQHTLAAVSAVALLLGMALGPVLVNAQSNQIVAAAAGTLTTDNPLTGAQTWNAGGVTFHGLSLAFTETASAAASQYIQVLGGAAGTTQEFAINKGGAMALGATTNQIILGVTNTTTLTAPAPAASTTLTLPSIGPSNAGSIPAAYNCGSTGSGSQTCTPAAAGGAYHIISGQSTLSGGAATITFPAGTTFTSTTSFSCTGINQTAQANTVKTVASAANTMTITETTGMTDVIAWVCAGT